MSNTKFNNKSLMGVLTLLIVIFLATEWYRNAQRDSGSKLPILVEMDSSAVTKIFIQPTSGEPVEVIKQSAFEWVVTEGSRKAAADPKVVKSYLQDLQNIKAQRLVSKTEDRWKDYSVTDSLALNVQLFEGEDVAVDLYVGRSRFTPSSGGVNGNTYIRKVGEVETYSAEGFLSANLNKGLDDWRFSKVLSFKAAELEDMLWTYPADSGFVLNKTAKAWKVDNTEADSAKVESFIISVINKVSRDFIYEKEMGESAPYQLKVNRKGVDPILIRAWKDPEDEAKYIIHSSLNEEAWFSSTKSGLFKQLFPPKSRFIK